MTGSHDDLASTSPESMSAESMSYEQLVEALEHLTERMADGEIGIEEAVDLYERAGRLEKLARTRLEQVQQRIRALAPESGGASGEEGVNPG